MIYSTRQYFKHCGQNTMSGRKLVEIQSNDLPHLRDLYKVDWPKNMLGYYTISNFIEWNKKDRKIKNFKIYSLNGDWSDGTFLILDRYQIFLNTLNKTNDNLLAALRHLEWTCGYQISACYERHQPAVLNVAEQLELQFGLHSKTFLYYLSKEDALKLDYASPTGITLRPMREEDAATADQLWPYRHEGSLYFLKRLINWNPNIGAFTDGGELVAWCFRLQAGSLGTLQTKAEHQRMGLGTLVTATISKMLAKMGHDISACVSFDNTASRKMFEKLGFKSIDTVWWSRTLPRNESFVWKDE